MNNQLELDLPKDYQSSEGFKEAAAEFHSNKRFRNMQPLFLCYNAASKDNKKFFVSYRFSKKMVQSFKKIQILDEHDDRPISA